MYILPAVKKINMDTTPIQVSARAAASPARVWECWTNPEHIMQWNQASADWHTPAAVNDLHTGGRFCFTMAARDGSASFDFCGSYTQVIPLREIVYRIDDGRMVTVTFTPENEGVRITEIFEPEQVHSRELQQAGWQAILDSFCGYIATLHR